MVCPFSPVTSKSTVPLTTISLLEKVKYFSLSFSDNLENALGLIYFFAVSMLKGINISVLSSDINPLSLIVIALDPCQSTPKRYVLEYSVFSVCLS